MNASLPGVLGRYPPDFRPLAEPESLGNAGGLSGARLWRYASRRGPMVARAWPRGGRGRAEIEAIHAWIGRAEPLGFVPVPIRAGDGTTVQEAAGTSWEVAPWMPGAADPNEPPPSARVRSAFESLAAFHRALGPGPEAASSPGLARRSREIEALPLVLDAWKAAVRSSPDDATRDLARRWIDRAEWVGTRISAEIRAAAGRPVPVQPVLRDARPGHFLFTGDRVTGLVDFGAMGIDPVSADLARLLSEGIGEDPALRSHALSSYAAVRPLDPAEAAAIEAFERSAALLGGARWIRWHFVERRGFDDPSAAERGLLRGVEKLERLFREMLASPGRFDY